jgi:hypothetical protein
VTAFRERFEGRRFAPERGLVSDRFRPERPALRVRSSRETYGNGHSEGSQDGHVQARRGLHRARWRRRWAVRARVQARRDERRAEIPHVVGGRRRRQGRSRGLRETGGPGGCARPEEAQLPSRGHALRHARLDARAQGGRDRRRHAGRRRGRRHRAGARPRRRGAEVPRAPRGRVDVPRGHRAHHQGRSGGRERPRRSRVLRRSEPRGEHRREPHRARRRARPLQRSARLLRRPGPGMAGLLPRRARGRDHAPHGVGHRAQPGRRGPRRPRPRAHDRPAGELRHRPL